MYNLPFLVDYDIPEDKDIAWAVHIIHTDRLGSPSVKKAEHPRQWLITATWDESPDSTNWLKVVDIVQSSLREGMLAEECMWKTVILITKWKGELRGIGLV